MTKKCRDYVGVACVNGTCPKANAEEYAERCMDVISDCDDCFYYEGCNDCALAGTEYCNGISEGGGVENDMQGQGRE